MRTEESSSGMGSGLSFLMGAAIGAGVALLVAPKSGRETREKLKAMAGDAKEKTGKYYDDMKGGVSEAAQKAQTYYEAGKESMKSAAEAGAESLKKNLSDRGEPSGQI